MLFAHTPDQLSQNTYDYYQARMRQKSERPALFEAMLKHCQVQGTQGHPAYLWFAARYPKDGWELLSYLLGGRGLDPNFIPSLGEDATNSVAHLFLALAYELDEQTLLDKHYHTKLLSFLNHKPNLNCLNNEGNTPYFGLITHGKVKTLDRVLKQQHGHIDLNLCNKQGYTPVMLAVLQTQQILETLFAHQDTKDNNTADLNIKNPINGDTALLIAAREGKEEAIRFLVKRGADASIPNNKGQTPLSVLPEQASSKVRKLLSKNKRRAQMKFSFHAFLEGLCALGMSMTLFAGTPHLILTSILSFVTGIFFGLLIKKYNGQLSKAHKYTLYAATLFFALTTFFVFMTNAALFPALFGGLFSVVSPSALTALKCGIAIAIGMLQCVSLWFHRMSKKPAGTPEAPTLAHESADDIEIQDGYYSKQEAVPPTPMNSKTLEHLTVEGMRTSFLNSTVMSTTYPSTDVLNISDVQTTQHSKSPRRDKNALERVKDTNALNYLSGASSDDGKTSKRTHKSRRRKRR